MYVVRTTSKSATSETNYYIVYMNRFGEDTSFPGRFQPDNPFNVSLAFKYTIAVIIPLNICLFSAITRVRNKGKTVKLI